MTGGIIMVTQSILKGMIQFFMSIRIHLHIIITLTLQILLENSFVTLYDLKIKFKLFNDNLVLDYRFFYKPRVDDFEDYLLEHELKVSIATFYEALTIDLNYTNKYNSRYDGEKKFINPETFLPYKARDENFTLGLSFMF